MARHKRSKKQLLQFFTQYGIHIWAILIIANAVMVYTYQFASHAAGKNINPVNTFAITGSPTPSLIIAASPSVSPSTGPLGPTISLTFTVPGIGSGGGVMKPIHLQRNVTVYLYAPNVNSMNPTVNPLYTVQGTATFDSDPASPTYTSYINPQFDLGSAVQDGNYQIAFRTDLSFTTLVKQNPSDVGGEVFGLSKISQTLQIPSQPVLMGDLIPNGNNYSFTINDYNAFINCFGDHNTTNSFCVGKNYGDFNDDGVIDGIDYNILLRSLNALVQQGQTLPTISPTISVPQRVTKLINTVTPTTAPKKAPVTPKPATSQKGSSAIGGILFVIFLLILGAIGVILYLKNEKIHNTINTLIHLSPTGTPAPDTTESTETTEATASTETSADETAPETPQATQTPPIAPPAVPAPSTAGGIIEKDCYIKKKGPDEAGTGLWLLLTDDNGAVNAHYVKNDIQDGFAKVKGVMKTENGKTFMEISELSAEG